jgi:hypothetical protein
MVGEARVKAESAVIEILLCQNAAERKMDAKCLLSPVKKRDQR